MDKKCKNCKWWDIEDEDVKDGRGRCLKAIEDWVDGSEKSLMITLDGSRYMALLLTKPEFSCILFEEKNGA